jgi:phosphoglucomutase
LIFNVIFGKMPHQILFTQVIMMETTPIERAKSWASNPYFEQAERDEILELIDSGNTQEITERFHKDLEFGTGGLRSIIAFGPNRINKYTIRKATQALAQEVLKVAKDNPKLAISYDSRRFSFEFAKECAGVLAANGIKALIFETLNPVPLLSFALRHYKASAGIMITASHNPPAYNGFKAYWSDGAQVTPPQDKNVIENYRSIQDFSEINYMDFNEGLEKGLIEWIGKEVEDIYFATLKKYIINPKLCQEQGKELKIVFTPIHGTGLVPCTRILDEMGLTNYQVVEEQAKPDPNFSTVKSPNPEDPSAMAMAVDLMKKSGADIAFGTDPDTDRLGVAVMDGEDVFFPNGNQIGLLMLHYIVSNTKLPKNPYMVKTIVTSNLLQTVAEKYGLKVFNTLTGFKWICSKMKEFENSGADLDFVFGTEESFGYLNHPEVRDKDGVASLGLMAELTLWYKTQGLNIIEALDKIYDEFGFSFEKLFSLDYLGKKGAEKIARIMEMFRNNSNNIFEGLESMEDYSIGEKVDESGEKTTLNLPKSNVLGFKLKGGDTLYLRPSGTEPKIKFYIMIQENEGSLSEKKKRAMEKTESMLALIKEVVAKA